MDTLLKFFLCPLIAVYLPSWDQTPQQRLFANNPNRIKFTNNIGPVTSKKYNNVDKLLLKKHLILFSVMRSDSLYYDSYSFGSLLIVVKGRNISFVMFSGSKCIISVAPDTITGIPKA